MISGIKRRTTAIESTQRYFQTIDLIISHFKRPADMKKIYELINGTPNLNTLLIATAAIHLYHNMGIRIQAPIENDQLTYNYTKNVEFKEKKTLMEEVELLLKNSFNLEIDMLNKIIDLENLFISLLIEERELNLSENQIVSRLNEIDKKIEYELLEIISKYPEFYFFDFIGDLIGLSNDIKINILEKGSAFKDLSVEIEKKLEREEKEDKFIELSTLNELRNTIQSDFEFKSYKELQIQTMPVRMIKKRILDNEFDRYPISIPGLRAFLKGNDLKKKIIKSIKNALKEKISYEQFEEKMLSLIKAELISQLKSNPNDFIYMIQNLYEASFDEIIFQMNKHGVHDILHLIKSDDNLAELIKKNLVRYNIKKQDFLILNDKRKNLISLAKKEICNLDFQILNDVMKNFDNIKEFNLSKLLNRDTLELQKVWKILETKLGCSINELREFMRKKQIIDKVFFQDLKLSNYDQIITLLNFDEIINNLVKDIFFYILSKILRQLSRIIELYNKLTNDKGLILLALKKIDGTLDYEDWINIKLEELIIQRLIYRQTELVTVFNANNQVFLVNGFILSRLTDKSLLDSISELRNKPSLIYEGIKSLKLKADLISPISYCIAFDLIKRLELNEELRKSEVEQIIESEKKEAVLKKKEIRAKQEESTFNWIERRITSSLMGINRPGINPNQFYWQNKDTKAVTANIKLHSELSGDPLTRFCEYYHFAIEKIKMLTPDIKLPNDERIEITVNNIVEKILFERLKHKPKTEEIKTMLDGEKLEIGKQIAIKIGEDLDKALYFKFKTKRKDI